jgi:hypothetical protein
VSQALLLANGLVGVALPGAIAIINRAEWSPRVKSAVAFLVCLVAAAVTCAASGDVTLVNWGAGSLVVFTAARTSYAGLWHPTGAAPAIEKATSPTPSPTRDDVKQAIASAPVKPTDAAPATKAEPATKAKRRS